MSTDELILGVTRDMSFHCRIFMKPTPKAAIKHTRNGIGYFPKKTKDAMKLIKRETLQKKIARFSDPSFKPLTNPDDPLFSEAVTVELIFSFIRPKSVKAHIRPYPSVVPDIDNLAKLTLDSLQPHIIKDDCLIVTLYKQKIYNDVEYIDILIRDKK